MALASRTTKCDGKSPRIYVIAYVMPKVMIGITVAKTTASKKKFICCRVFVSVMVVAPSLCHECSFAFGEKRRFRILVENANQHA